MTANKSTPEVPPPPPATDISTPEHRALYAEALELYAADQARVDPERAALARRAAQRVRAGGDIPLRVGHFYHPVNGWVDNFACLFCPVYSNTSERLAGIHAEACCSRHRPAVQPARTVGGIT